ncbi:MULTISPECIES: rhodanese-like domain-containing protein [Streptomyces]|uniref:rhodanese-like domain-containing protein n=1 Tax=Streptomyces TaxID=1883 RepID=UPI00069A5CF8|nr:rhodanese-like domain-containing protein [Streptomyces sp. SID7805]MYU52271.1 rhodanese-like domain-containing protein [Streptomyces sp. SID7805]
MFCRRGAGRHTPAQAHRHTSGGRAVLLDARAANERPAGYVPGAPHLPPSRLTAGAGLPATAPGKPMATIRRGGHRSPEAVKVLAGGGEARDVAGSIAARVRDGLPVTGRNGSTGVIS